MVLLFGYHTSTSSTLATSAPTSIVTSSSSAGTSESGGSSGWPSGGTGDGSGAGSGPSHGSGSGSKGSGSTGSSGSASSTSTVTGDVAQTMWGPVQVQLTLKGGTISAVDVLQHPSGNPRDDEINSYALPILIQETTEAQGSNIDMVSGATVTSTGYLQSLQSALDQAGA